jgi:hypothetical protein
VKLSVGGVEQTRSLEVLKDPNTGGSVAEIGEQVKMLEAIRSDMNDGAKAVTRVEKVRVQLDDLLRLTTDAEVRRTATALGAKLTDLEMMLVDLRQTGGGQDGIRFGSALISKLGYLAGGLAGGDFRPTNQQVEVQAILKDQVRTQLGAIDAALGADLGALNAMLRAKNVPNIVGGVPALVP